MKKAELEAIIRTLAASVENGLNASLSPADCKVILTCLFDSLPLRPMRANRTSVSMGRMKSFLRDFADGVLDDLVDGQGPPPRKGQKND
ncbi:MAG: hypothetical protein KAV87_17445 [Desulfobacteraceae bacterium]|nr:hypothetical protein [Desulfobacteraceae bacterium]